MDIRITVEVDGHKAIHESRVLLNDPRDTSFWRRAIQEMIDRDLGNERILNSAQLTLKGALRGIIVHIAERARGGTTAKPPEQPTAITVGPLPDPKDYAIGVRLAISHLGMAATFERVSGGWVCIASSEWPHTAPIGNTHAHVPESAIEQAKAEYDNMRTGPIEQCRAAVLRELRKEP